MDDWPALIRRRMRAAQAHAERFKKDGCHDSADTWATVADELEAILEIGETKQHVAAVLHTSSSSSTSLTDETLTIIATPVTNEDIHAAANNVNGNDHWVYGAQWMRTQLWPRIRVLLETISRMVEESDERATETQRLKLIEARATERFYALDTANPEHQKKREVAQYILEGHK